MAASAAITLGSEGSRSSKLTDKRARTAIASVVIAMFLPFILMTFMILCALDGTSTHNFSAVDLSFHGGALCLQRCRRSTGSISRTSESFQDLIRSDCRRENLRTARLMPSGRSRIFMPCISGGAAVPLRPKAFVECFLAMRSGPGRWRKRMGA